MAKSKQVALDTGQTCTREFIKLLQASDGTAAYREFERFAECAYVALAKPNAPLERRDDLEARFTRIEKQVGRPRIEQYAEMLALTVRAMELSNGGDFLGGLMSSDDVRAINPHIGQYFTPFELSRLMAKIVLGDLPAQLREQPYLSICEPTVGAGGMVLAVAMEAREQGINLHRDLWFDATDISPLCYHVAFIQMSLAGCSGIVRHANALDVQTPTWETALTPMSWRFHLAHGWPGQRAESVPEFAPDLELAAAGPPKQGVLW